MTQIDEAVLFARMQSLDDTERFSYSERGRICLTVKNSLMHRERIDPETGEPCSLSAWIRLACPWGYATAFRAMRDFESLADVPAEHLAKMPEANIGILKQLSTAVRNEPAVLLAAQTQRSDEFIENIKRAHPDQHIQHKEVLRFVVDETQASEINKAIAISMERGAMSRTEALMDMAINYRSDVLLEELAKQ